MQLTQLRSYARPTDLDSAVELLRRGGRGTRVMAAGTDLVLSGSDEVTGLVDVGDLGLAYVEERDGAVAIGAMTTLTELLEHPVAAGYLEGVVPEMLRQVGSPLLRNVATVGGNLVRKQPWSDVIPLFRALGASMTLFDGEERSGSIDDLYTEAAHLTGAILTEVALPRQPARTAAAFWKFTRSAVDIATLNCAVLIQAEEDGCVRARIFVGATPRLAAAVPSAEAALVGTNLSAAAVAAAARAAADEVSTCDDLRATAAYRTRLVSVGITRCLEHAKRRLEAVTP
jgi:aerobic carbon-monoxide dehydrogenase medium subunit